MNLPMPIKVPRANRTFKKNSEFRMRSLVRKCRKYTRQCLFETFIVFKGTPI